MRAKLLSLAGLMLAANGCGDGFAPSPITLRVSVVTSGVDFDPDGYRVQAAGTGSRVAVDGRVGFVVAPGAYLVTLDDLAPNCLHDGPQMIRAEVPSYTIAPTEVVTVTFHVACYATSATIDLVVRTAGRDFPLVGYIARVTGGPGFSHTQPAVPNGTTGISGLAAGSYTVALEGLTDNCAVEGEAAHTVGVTTGALTRDSAYVTFSVSCAAITGDVDLFVRTSGSRPDSDGYLFELDGEPITVPDFYSYFFYYDGGTTPLRLSATGNYLVERIPPGEHALKLTDLASNCTVSGVNPQTISLAVGRRITVGFDVLCT